MGEVRVIVLAGFGTNCERETAYACRAAGADQVDIVHQAELIYGEKRLDDYNFLCLPGGFLDGDNLGAAQAAAHRFRYARVKTTGEPLLDQLLSFIDQGGVVLGICNGFQLMVKLGLLPGLEGRYTERLVSLTYNDSGRFEDRWVWLKVNQDSPCIFTRGLNRLYLPIRHGEGKFVTLDDEVLKNILSLNLHTLQYISPETEEPTEQYPFNPNGSTVAIAGICDPSGRLFGLMPHPEAFNHRTNHPFWTRESLPEEGLGLQIFRNAIEYLREQSA